MEEARAHAEVARKIYELRIKAGLTQAALAKLVGTSASAISRLENADYEGHSLAMLNRIAAALDRRVEMRFLPRRGYSGDPRAKPFVRGTSGNPGGRPTGFTRLIQHETNGGEELVDFALTVLRHGSLKQRQWAVEWLADRGFGRPVQTNVLRVEDFY